MTVVFCACMGSCAPEEAEPPIPELGLVEQLVQKMGYPSFKITTLRRGLIVLSDGTYGPKGGKVYPVDVMIYDEADGDSAARSLLLQLKVYKDGKGRWRASREAEEPVISE